MKKLVQILILASAASAFAQQADPTQAATDTQPGEQQTEETQTPQTVWKQDGRAVSSAVPRTVGTPSGGPSLQSLYQSLTTDLAFTQNMGSRSGNLPAQDNGFASSFSGSIRASKRFGKNQFRGSYSGGYSYYYDTPAPERVFHSALLSHSFAGRKWSIGVHDQVRYTPEAGFGFEPLSGSEDGSLDPGVTPTDTILTNFGSRITNSASADVSYRLSSSNTFSGSATYGIFRFLDELGGFESDQVNARFSFDHRFDARQSMYLTYGYGFIDYIGNVPGLDFHNIQVGYSRQIAGKLTFQGSAGPEIRNQGLFGGGTLDNLGWSASVNTQYAFNRRSNAGFSFSRSTSNGGGLTPGSTQNRLEGRASMRFARVYTNSVRFGYAHNEGLASTVNTDSFYGGYDLSRSFRNGLNVRLGYFAQAQQSSSACAGSLCQFDGLRQGVIVGLRYSFHPLDVFERR
jgi:hypothetical protein